MDSAPGPGDSAAAGAARARTIELSAESLPPRSILDPILTQTAVSPAPAELAALREALRHVRGQAFSRSPVVVELVSAILWQSQASRAADEPILRAMVEQIAATLFEDPVSRGRLEALWTRLSES